MQKSGIEYLTHVWNFMTGCKNQENGVCTLPCWARAMSNRFHRSFEPEFHPEKLGEPLTKKRGGRRIGVCFTGDLFGDWSSFNENHIQRQWIFNMMAACPDDQFFFLTKCPWNLLKWGEFPDNAWVGVSVCNNDMLARASVALAGVKAKHKWLSIEPLLEKLDAERIGQLGDIGVNWLVIGGQTNPTKLPGFSWVKEIIDAADNKNIPVWLKNNMAEIATVGDGSINSADILFRGSLYRQELPRHA